MGINNNKIFDTKIIYREVLSEIYNAFDVHNTNTHLEEYIRIVEKSCLPQKLKQRLKSTIQRKVMVMQQRSKNLGEFSLQTEEEKKQQLGFEYQSSCFYGNILGLLLTKEQTKHFFQKGSDFEVLGDIELGFYLKDSASQYGFDIIVATRKDILEHEVKEAFFSLFQDENQKGISLFHLDDPLLNEYDEGVLSNRIISDIFSHIASSGDNLVEEVKTYLLYTDFAMQKHPSFVGVLSEVKNFLENFLGAASDEKENLFSSITVSMSAPKRLFEYIRHKKIEDIFDTKGLKDTIQYQIFTLLSKNLFDVRYCVVITHKVKETKVIREEESRKEIIKTPLHMGMKNIDYLWSLYIGNLKASGEVVKVTGNLKDGMTLTRSNGREDKVLITKDGYITFEVLEVDIVEKKYEITKKGKKYDDGIRVWGLKEIGREDLGESKKVGQYRVGVQDNELQEATDTIQKEEREIEENLEFIDKNLAEFVSECENTFESTQKDGKVAYLVGIYDTALKDTILNELNIELKKQYAEETDKVDNYLYKELEGLSKIREDKNTITKTIVFTRKYIVGAQDTDKVVIDIIYDKKTGTTTIRKDWIGMCSGHQVMDAYLEELLSEKWGLEATRIDQKEESEKIPQKKSLLNKSVLTNEE